MAGPIFLPKVAGFPRPRSHMTCIFGFLVHFAEEVKKASLKGKSPEAKNIEKTLFQETIFFQNLFA
jgi:hypothetical protein